MIQLIQLSQMEFELFPQKLKSNSFVEILTRMYDLPTYLHGISRHFTTVVDEWVWVFVGEREIKREREKERKKKEREIDWERKTELERDRERNKEIERETKTDRG